MQKPKEIILNESNIAQKVSVVFFVFFCSCSSSDDRNEGSSTYIRPSSSSDTNSASTTGPINYSVHINICKISELADVVVLSNVVNNETEAIIRSCENPYTHEASNVKFINLETVYRGEINQVPELISSVAFSTVFPRNEDQTYLSLFRVLSDGTYVHRFSIPVETYINYSEFIAGVSDNETTSGEVDLETGHLKATSELSGFRFFIDIPYDVSVMSESLIQSSNNYRESCGRTPVREPESDFVNPDMFCN